MKKSLKIFSLFAAASLIFSACDKEKKYDKLGNFANGVATALSTSTTTVAPAIADANNKVVTYSWTSPKYAQDSSLYKYILQFDSAGRGFVNPVSITIIGKKDTALTGSQINSILAQLGLTIGKTFNVDTRIISSYGNNNERYLSNVITSSMTSYIVPVTLSVTPTTPLTLVIGDAANTALTFNWTATSYGPYAVNYKLQVDVSGGTFASPQVFDFGTALTGSLTVSQLNTAALNLGVASNATKGMQYRVVATIATKPANTVNSNVVTNTITTYLPFLYLWVPGGYQGWDPGSAPQLGATIPDLNNFEGYINTSGGEFKINNAPDWGHTNYGGTATTLDPSGSNLVWPSAGYYLVKANPTALTWSTTLITTWGVVGDATPGGWGASTPLTYDAVNKVWTGTINFSGTGGWKFRANDAWDINLGGTPTYLKYGGDNIGSPSAGPHVVKLDLSSPLKYTYTVL